MREIFSKLLYEMEKGGDTVIVTLVDGSGSTPAKAGSQMLVNLRGRIAGTVGGGAIEKLAEQKAIDLIGKKRSALEKFDLRAQKDGGIGMACGGESTALFQYISASSDDWLSVAKAVTRFFDEGIEATLHMRIDGDTAYLKARDGTLLAGREANAGEKTYAMPLPLGARAVIFGGGHIALALVPLLRSVNFRPVVFDDRPEFAAPERFPEAEKVIHGDYTRIGESLALTKDDYIVVMTNAHTHDFEVQRQVLSERFAYIGVIGSAKKKAAVNARLLESGISEHSISRVHTPIGLPIKAATPAEIAVSIAAEMILERQNNAIAVNR